MPWVALFVGDLYLRRQQADMDQRAAHYFAQTPTLINNASAQQFDRLSALLGLEPNARYASPIELDPADLQAYKTIEPILTPFIERQANRVSGPLSVLPPVLTQYLSEHRATLASIETHLLSAPLPEWATDAEEIVDPYAVSPGFVNVRAVHKLLLLSAVEASHEGRQDEMMNALEASWRLNEAIAQRSDLSSEVLVSVVSVWQAGLLRHLGPWANVDMLVDQWQERLILQAQSAPVLSGVRYESWLQYRITQQSWLPALSPRRQAGALEKLRASLHNRFSFQTYFKLVAIENTQVVQQGLDQLATLDVCATSQISAERLLGDIQLASWNEESGLSPHVSARRWKTSGNRALALELSQYVLAIKQTMGSRAMWPSAFPPQPSQVCPGESWVYTRHDNGSVSLVLSKQLLTPGPIPLRYRSTTKP